jgi:hypothetical protein
MEIEGGWSRSEIEALNRWYRTYPNDVSRFGFHKGKVMEINVEKIDFTNRIHVGYIFDGIYNLLSNDAK